MEPNDIPITRFSIDWPLMLADRRKFEDIREVGRYQPGVLILDNDGTVTFLDEGRLYDAVGQEEVNSEYAGLRSLYEKAKQVHRHPYDPATDAVVAFKAGSGIKDTLADGRGIVARAWWVRSGRRSIRRVNLEDTDDELLRFALGR